MNIDNSVDFVSWRCPCVLDEDTAVLTGEGFKTSFLGEGYEEDPATFALRSARNQPVWRDDAVQPGEGVVLERS